MEKLIKKLDEIFAKYKVEDADIEAVGDLINELGGGAVNDEGEEFVEDEVSYAVEDDDEEND